MTNLLSSSRPSLRQRVLSKLPATLTAIGGFAITKLSGIWTIKPDWGQLATLAATAVTDPTSRQVWIWDPVADDYNTLTLAGLGDCLFKLTSTSSFAVGAGSKGFTTQSGKDIADGGFVLISSDAAPTTNYMFGQVTGYAGTTLTVNVVYAVGSGTHTDWTIRIAGAQGASIVGGIRQAYSATTTDADPGAGIFRLNNATPASATAAYLDNLDSAGSTVSGVYDLWDDSTNTVRGSIRFEKASDPTVWAQYNVTGSVVDGTGYRKLTLANGAGSGAFTAADIFSITFTRAGDTGALTTGVTGVLKGAAGVVSAATAGTDYMKPDTTSALTAGFTSASVSAGTKTTGTYTFDPTAGSVQHVTNGGAHTFAPPVTHGSWFVDYVNNGSAGVITRSGWTKDDGDPLDTTNGHSWRFYMSVGNQGSHLNKVRMV